MSGNGLLFNLALTHLTGRVRQTVIAVFGVALGVAFFIAMAGLMQGFQQFFISKIIDVSPHIVMQDDYRERPRQAVSYAYDMDKTAVSLNGVKPKEEIRGIKNAEKIISALRKMPDVHISPMLEGQIFYRYGSTDLSSTLKGIQPKYERYITKLENDMTAGSLDELQTHSDGVIVGDGLADNLNAHVGDTLTGISVAGLVRKMKVVGIFHTGITELDNTVSYTLLKDAQVIQSRPNVINAIRFALKDPYQAEGLAQRIERRFKYKTVSWQEANEGVLSVFIIQNIVRYTTTSAILLVACFGIYNIISTLINEKARDIAILKSIGFTEGNIQQIFIVQGMMIGFSGMIIGWGLGFAMSRGLEALPIHMNAIITAEKLFIVYDIHNYIYGGIACLVAATVAAWLPARKAARLKPVDIIRGAAG